MKTKTIVIFSAIFSLFVYKNIQSIEPIKLHPHNHTTTVIDSPGSYKLTINQRFSPTNPETDNTAIRITSGNVFLDLDYKTIKYTGNDPNSTITGITIDPSLFNTTIKNGNIIGFTNSGIRTSTGCGHTVYSNLYISDCKKSGIHTENTYHNLFENCYLLSNEHAGIIAKNSLFVRAGNCLF